MDNTQIITTTGDKLREVIATKFALIGAAIDTEEATAKLPYIISLRDAEGALAKLDLDDDTLEAAYDNGLAAADIRATISATYTPQKANAEATIAKIEADADTRRAKLVAVGDDVGSSPAAELLALVEVEGIVTTGSVQVGLAAWIQAQIQQERDAIAAAQDLHGTNISVFSTLQTNIGAMSNDEIFDVLNIEE